MAPLNKIVIDTDPGVDDVLAMLLAFAAKPEELEVLLVSVTFGNVDVQSCLRNVVSLFYHIEKEQEWRRQNGRPEGFEALKACKPIVAVGAVEPLADQLMMADYFHGRDGLQGIHTTHPHLSPEDTWKGLFTDSPNSVEGVAIADELRKPANQRLFTPSQRPAHEEILRILRENEEDTITIVTIGPQTNLAVAAAADPETFLRVKEVVVMGGCLHTVTGNVLKPPPPVSSAHPAHLPPIPPFALIKAAPSPLRTALNLRNQITPVAEFNVYADSIATARVFALTSPTPTTTMPPVPPAPPGKQSTDPPPPFLRDYPENLSKQLNLTLFPLDITEHHLLTRSQFEKITAPQIEAGSPIAIWAHAFISATFAKIASLDRDSEGRDVGLALHDPLCVWYVMAQNDPKWTAAPNSPEDIRLETSGQWTRGMCVVDGRTRKKRAEGDASDEIPGDTGNWLHVKAGNRIRRMVSSPGADRFGTYLWQRVFNEA